MEAAGTGIGVHDDFVSGQCDERASRHGVVWNENRDLPLMPLQGTGDLLRSENEPPGRMENQIDRHILGGHSDRPEQVLRIFDVDIAGDGKSKEAHGLLPMNHGDHSRLALLLNVSHNPQSLGGQKPFLKQGNENLNEDDDP
jgi:hypothetical protein